MNPDVPTYTGDWEHEAQTALQRSSGGLGLVGRKGRGLGVAFRLFGHHSKVRFSLKRGHEDLGFKSDSELHQLRSLGIRDISIQFSHDAFIGLE